LLCDHLALAGLLVELVEELVLARLQRVDRHRGLAAGWNHLFLPEVAAFELDRALALVDDVDAKALAGRHFDRRGLENAVTSSQLVGSGFPRQRAGGEQRSRGEYERPLERDRGNHVSVR